MKVTPLCPALCDPVDCSIPDSPVLHYLPGFASWWCYLSISSSATLFSSCLQSFPASGSFPVSWLFTPGGQRIGASASASVLLMNTQGWFPLELTGSISLLSEGLSRIFSTTIWRHLSFQILNSRIEWTFPPCLTAILDLGRLLMKGAKKGSWSLWPDVTTRNKRGSWAKKIWLFISNFINLGNHCTFPRAEGVKSRWKSGVLHRELTFHGRWHQEWDTSIPYQEHPPHYNL